MSEFRNNHERQRYEMDVEGGQLVADYQDRGGVSAITRVFTPVELRGRGLAGALMKAVVEDARAQGVQLKAVCPYAVAYAKRYPETQDVLI